MGSYLPMQISWLSHAFRQLITQMYTSGKAVRAWKHLSTEKLVVKNEIATNLN